MRAKWQNREVAAGKLRLRLIFGLYKLLGRRLLGVILVLPVLAAYPFLTKAKKASRDFFQVLQNYTHKRYYFATWRHIYSFALSLLDKLGAWSGRIGRQQLHYTDVPAAELFWTNLSQKKGMLLICSHLGNIELLRAMADDPQYPVRVNAFMDTTPSQAFNEFIKDCVNAQAGLNLHSAENIGIDKALELAAKIAAGELLVIAGDRLSASNPQNTVEAEFLGRTIRLPQGAFVLARILKCPVFFAAITPAKRGKYNVRLKYFTADLARNSALLAREYASWLAGLVEKHPFQWYNFYNYFE
jgi:predicted LPLAT superfamily acyltransferase